MQNDYTFSIFKTQSKDGTKLHGHYLKPSDQPKAVIYFIHGLGGHSRRFLKPASLFAQNNIASIGIDLRGNGLSEGKKGHAETLKKYMEDIDACMSHGLQLFSDSIPKLIMGNSMGGALALQYSITHKHLFSGVILTAPWLRLTHPINKIKLGVMNILNKLKPQVTFSSKVKTTQEEENRKEKGEYEIDELIHKQITARLFMIIHHIGNYLLNKADCYLPTIVLHSTNDPVTDYHASKELCNKHSLSCKLITLDYLTHDVPFEENNIVFREVKKHINKLLVAHEQFQN